MNIIFVSREYPPSKRIGGIGYYVHTCAQYMANIGHTVHVVAASDNISKQYIESDGKVIVHRLSGGDFYISDKSTLKNRIYNKVRQHLCFSSYRHKLSKYLENLISQENIQILEFPEFGAEHFYWKDIAKIPFITRLHGPTLLDRSTGNRKKSFPILGRIATNEISCIKGSNYITSPSKAMANWFAKHSDIDRNKINYLPNCIDYEFWKKTNPIEPINKNNGIKIFAAGTIVESKGFGDLVSAVESLVSDGYEIKLRIAGRIGLLGQQLQNRINKDQPCRKWLEVVGLITPDELISYYQTATICVFPSWWEPFGLTCIEAMAAGAITIGSSSGGMAEIISDGDNGFLIEPKSTAKLRGAILKILNMSENDLILISSKAMETAQLYSSRNIIEDQIKFYFSVIRENQK